MNTDIRLSIGFWQHPKTRKTAKRLGLEGVRSLQILWLWAAVNRPDGILSGMDWEDIELAADWMGEERAFFDHILGMWLDETPGGYVLHDWQEHNSWAAEAEVRGKQSRLAKLAQVNREAYDECVRRGITELTAEEYKRLKCAPTATALRPNSDLTAAQQRPQSAPTADASASLGPAPAPSPSPEEINTRGGSNNACAREDAPPRADAPSKSHPQWAAFLSCWQVYPVQQGQEEAWREWMRLHANGTLAEVYAVRDAILLLAAEDSRWQRGKVPRMAKWLSGKGWNDKPYVEPVEQSRASPHALRVRAPTEHQRRLTEREQRTQVLLAERGIVLGGKNDVEHDITQTLDAQCRVRDAAFQRGLGAAG